MNANLFVDESCKAALLDCMSHSPTDTDPTPSEVSRVMAMLGAKGGRVMSERKRAALKANAQKPRRKRSEAGV